MVVISDPSLWDGAGLWLAKAVTGVADLLKLVNFFYTVFTMDGDRDVLVD